MSLITIAIVVISSWVILNKIRNGNSNKKLHIPEEKLKNLWESVENSIRDLEAEINHSANKNKLVWPKHPVLGNITAIDTIECLLEIKLCPFMFEQGEGGFPPDEKDQEEYLKSADRFLTQQRRDIYAGGIDQEFLNQVGEFWESVEYDSVGEPILLKGVTVIMSAITSTSM
ncbi:hypothetical protein EYS14_14800 [Alteromonadaceae bacterium M269]|nr:hypothetical protein EYS14_14800 [Alteromonadaceae bacterium M269]